MYPNSITSSRLMQPVSSQPLLSSPQSRVTFRERLTHVNFTPRGLCLQSKAIVLILFWSLIVGAMYMTAQGGTNVAAEKLGHQRPDFFHNYYILLCRLLFLLVFLLYPFAGFLADVCCGRYKVIIISFCLLASGMAFLSVGSVLLFQGYTRSPFSPGARGVFLFFVVAFVGLLLLVTGFAGYEANFIQFGIDQLMEAPNECLGLFVHWVEWFTMMGATFAQFTVSLIGHCSKSQSAEIYYTIISLPLVYLFLLLIVLVFTFWKRHWFNVEPARSNPYKVVVAVLNFARKHKYPVSYSTYVDNDDEEPSRLDYAKEMYGGPFTTEQVEDVKMFLRILVMLLALGPVFALEVPVGPLLPVFVQHVVMQGPTCGLTEILSDISSLKRLTTTVLFPVYVWVIYSVLRRRIPKIFSRIIIGIIVLTTGIVSMFFIELLGHYLHSQHSAHGVMCMFQEIRNTTDNSYLNHLDIPWAANLIPGILSQVGLMVLLTTAFEFISAQSPHAMKGLLIGVMFTVRGLFQLFMSLAILPFAVKEIWGTKWMKANPPPVTNCGFGYLLLTSVTGLVGLGLFLVAMKRYKYRERVG